MADAVWEKHHRAETEGRIGQRVRARIANTSVTGTVVDFYETSEYIVFEVALDEQYAWMTDDGRARFRDFECYPVRED